MKLFFQPGARGRFETTVFAIAIAISWIVLSNVTCSRAPIETSILVDSTQRFQTMHGWQVGDQCGQLDSPHFARYADELFDRAVNELGINRVGLSILPSSEHPEDLAAPFVRGEMAYADFKPVSHGSINDNDDPFVAAPNGFHWTQLDFLMDTFVLPMRRRVAANGEQLEIVLTHVDFQEFPFEHREDPEEYAELIESAFLHLQEKYGVTPDLIEPILEPDAWRLTDGMTKGWTGTHIGRAIVATGQRLERHGMRPGWIVPSTQSAANASDYFDEISAVPGALEYVHELSYHRYRGGNAENLAKLTSRARRHGLRTSMLEWIGADHETLFEDLTTGNNGAWQQFVLAYPEADNGAQHYVVGTDDQGAPTLTLGSRSRYLRQYFRYIRRGAVRIGCSAFTSAGAVSADVSPVAFEHPGGGQVVVIASRVAGPLYVSGLAAGRWGQVLTTESETSIERPHASVSADGTLMTSLAEPGVLTLYQLD